MLHTFSICVFGGEGMARFAPRMRRGAGDVTINSRIHFMWVRSIERGGVWGMSGGARLSGRGGGPRIALQAMSFGTKRRGTFRQNVCAEGRGRRGLGQNGA